jgi:MFS superfamily sulfate permease-like transporter
MEMNEVKRWANVRPGYWFAPKLFGWGATPVTWQGWLVTAVFVVVLIGISRGLEGPARWLSLLLAIVGFTTIIWRKTDGGWRWRWGSTRR